MADHRQNDLCWECQGGKDQRLLWRQWRATRMQEYCWQVGSVGAGGMGRSHV